MTINISTFNPPPIHELPREVVERIAAGEVIERPASVARELIENALDAGATEVRVELREGGLRLIRVADDGWGIRPEDLARACLPHTTSKVARVDDLARLTTLGFRGEALASVAMVAELTVASASDDAGIAHEITLRAGAPDVVIAHGDASRGRGTTVAARNLFQTMPARRALLRGPSSEASRALAVVRAYALAYPAVRFTLTSDGALLLQSPGADLPATVAALYGADVARALLTLAPVALAEADLTGMVAARGLHFPSREHVYVSVNGRPVANRALLAAAEAGYRPLLRKGRHPLLIARILSAPDRVDVNIHPAKIEALLRDEQPLAAALRQATHDALGAAPISIVTAGAHPAGAQFATPTQLRLPSAPGRRRGLRIGEGRAGNGWPGGAPGRAAPMEWLDDGAPAARALPELAPLAQFDNTLILAESPEGQLFLVDQHRAHERVLYERLKQAMRQRIGAASDSAPDVASDEADGTGGLDDRLGGVFGSASGQGAQPTDTSPAVMSSALPGQMLLEPLLIELTPGQAETLTARLDELATVGLECQPFGGSVFLVRALPVAPGATQNAAAFARELAQDAAEESDDWLDHVCVSLACRSAIRRGQPLSLPEQRALLADLRAASVAAVCPHGSPLAVYHSRELLTRLFGW